MDQQLKSEIDEKRLVVHVELYLGSSLSLIDLYDASFKPFQGARKDVDSLVLVEAHHGFVGYVAEGHEMPEGREIPSLEGLGDLVLRKEAEKALRRAEVPVQGVSEGFGLQKEVAREHRLEFLMNDALPSYRHLPSGEDKPERAGLGGKRGNPGAPHEHFLGSCLDLQGVIVHGKTIAQKVQKENPSRRCLKTLIPPVFRPIMWGEREGFMRFRVLICAVLLLAACAAVSAATITVTVVQNEEAPDIAIQMSRTVEDELLGQYFNAGQIVSNTEVMMSGSRFSEKNFGIKEAAFGMSDYLLVVYLQYGPGERVDEEKKISWAELKTITWRIVAVPTSRILEERSIEYSVFPVDDFDPYQQARKPAGMIVRESLPVIDGDRQGEKR